MRHADQTERIVAVHEVSHMAMCYWNKFVCQGVYIKRVGDITKGVGVIKLPPFPKGWRTEHDAQIDLVVHYYKILMIFSAGYLSEWMYAGQESFWKRNSEFLKPAEKTDFKAIREVADIIIQKEFVDILNFTHKTLAQPDHWGVILELAKQLKKYKGIEGIPSCLTDGTADDEEPEHNPTPLIKHIAMALYREEGRKVA